MSNMSYCRFSNTSQDLRDCVNAMDEAYFLSELDLSSDELASMKLMRKLCNQFLANLERLENTEEFYEEGEEVDC